MAMPRTKELRDAHAVVIRVGKLGSLRPAGTLRNNPTADRIRAQYEWCCDETRPGEFTRDTSMDEDARTLLLTYTFSDPNTAFEFRMRFG